MRKKASPVLWQRRSSTEPTFVLEKKENVTTFECFFLSIDCIQPFLLARARCLSAGLRYLRLTRLPRHDRGPVSGGNRSAASCLCTVLRRALYHYATRSPSIDCIQPNLCRFLATGRDFGKFFEKSSDSSAAKFRGSGGFGAEKNEKRVERKKKDLRFFPCPGQASASAPYCS